MKSSYKMLDETNGAKASTHSISNNVDKQPTVDINLKFGTNDNLTAIDDDQSRQEQQANKRNGSKLSPNGDDTLAVVTIQPTLKRYFILIMYGICSMEKSFQWINLSTITNKVALYYDVDNLAVNWTSVLFMIMFIPLVLPTGWLIERIGLRKAVLIGSSGITLGAIIKCFACDQERFYIIILGQIIVSISEQFIFCIPARIASVWFPDHQVSLATGFGIFGNQCGIALAFLIPQAMLSGMETRQEIGVGLYRLFWWTALVSFLTWLVLILCFDNEPRHAPGWARLRKINQEEESRLERKSFLEEMKVFGSILRQLMSSVNCDLLIVAYGINVGTGYAIQTLLNQMIAGGGSVDSASIETTTKLTTASESSASDTSMAETTRMLADDNNKWTDPNEIVGTSGLIVIFCGMIGALFWGHLCDVTHKYILITRLLYLGAILAMVFFGLTLSIYSPLALYAASALMGFMLIGYTVAGLDTIVELTYPVPELVSTSVMNLSPQIFGTPITFLCSIINDRYDNQWAVAFLVACLALGLIITVLIREHLNRQTAVIETEKSRQLGAIVGPKTATSLASSAHTASAAAPDKPDGIKLNEIIS